MESRTEGNKIRMANPTWREKDIPFPMMRWVVFVSYDNNDKPNKLNGILVLRLTTTLVKCV